MKTLGFHQLKNFFPLDTSTALRRDSSFIGPSIDILVNSSDYSEVLPIDFSLFGGVGYEFPFGLGLELRYKQGLIDIRDDYYDDYDYYDEDEDSFYNRNSMLNGVIQFGVTYKFDFSK